MAKILILFVHPCLEKSRANLALLRHIPSHSNITVHDLYETYPQFDVDKDKEQSLLLSHDIIVWHHPLYWYSAPPLLKQWMDIVLEFGWAYGPDGMQLKDKVIFNTFTSGGAKEAYQEDGYNQHSIREFLLPFEQSARLCRMNYLPPFAIQGTHRLSGQDLEHQSKIYAELLHYLLGDGDFNPLQEVTFLNDVPFLSKEDK